MITKLLNEVNEKIETLNNLVQNKEYFEKLDERIEKVNKYVQEQKQEIERLNKRIEDLNIINEEHQTLNEMIRKELQQKENIIKEVREYIKENTTSYYTDLEHTNEEFELIGDPKELLGILDKENNNENN